MCSWIKNFEQLMLLQGSEPYACLHDRCNHIARGTGGMMFHQANGSHHMNHSNRWGRTMLATQPVPPKMKPTPKLLSPKTIVRWLRKTRR